jgi:acetate kinase
MQVLCLNAGSSSLKVAGFRVDGPTSEPVEVMSLAVDRLGETGGPGPVEALGQVFDAFAQASFTPVDAVAHRVVHGGRDLDQHAVIDDAVHDALVAAIPFAPLHLPVELALVDAAREHYPDCPQVACLDIAFHRDLPPVARRLPIPAEFDAAGVRRYGFHGLSYEYLVHRLGDALGPRTVLAHLGNGASLAAVRDGAGCDTTMGLTPSGGLVMGTRTGDLDPGVLVHLLRTSHLDAHGLEQIVDHRSGLLGLSDQSSDVRDLLDASAAGHAPATLALEVYAAVAAKHIAALTTSLGGLDCLVFTAGVGERGAPVRDDIARRLGHLGVALDPAANAAHAPIISPAGAPVTVRVEPTNEESMMARHAARLVPA